AELMPCGVFGVFDSRVPPIACAYARARNAARTDARPTPSATPLSLTRTRAHHARDRGYPPPFKTPKTPQRRKSDEPRIQDDRQRPGRARIGSDRNRVRASGPRAGRGRGAVRAARGRDRACSIAARPGRRSGARLPGAAAVIEPLLVVLEVL